MENLIFNKVISKRGVLLTPIILIIGFLGLTFELPLDFLWLPISGGLSLYLMFGKNGLKNLLRKPLNGSWLFILGMIILSFLLSIGTSKFGEIVLNNTSNENSIADILLKGQLQDKLYTISTVWISLIGEELVIAALTIPIIIYMLKKNSNLNYNKTFFITSIITGVIFGLIHLPTYNWNIYQCIIVIGLTRIPFNYAWKRADSLWGGIIAHIIFDYILFIPPFLISFLHQ
ncbi:CPBP family intramembrane glutamic endopeptidase [Lactobacillus terrae]|uniref:CPBP family intramembrane glutamic endopeptidase n=1 Tax=Lactobacillus terrae TaxID=2269374 RepID=UPI000C1B6D7E|nr:CPBP family intramembrane glutamic endopeptidase [Lactobacillus terrae]